MTPAAISLAAIPAPPLVGGAVWVTSNLGRFSAPNPVSAVAICTRDSSPLLGAPGALLSASLVKMIPNSVLTVLLIFPRPVAFSVRSFSVEESAVMLDRRTSVACLVPERSKES